MRCEETTVGQPEKQRIEKVFFETMPSDKAKKTEKTGVSKMTSKKSDHDGID